MYLNPLRICHGISYGFLYGLRLTFTSTKYDEKKLLVKLSESDFDLRWLVF